VWSPPEPSSLRSRTLQTSPYALRDASPLELCDGRQDMHLQLPRGGSSINSFSQGDECNPERLQLLEHYDEMSQIAAKSIEPPADEHVESPPASVGKKTVELGPPILGSADAPVRIFCDRPARAATYRRSSAS
jgi:hypothetical protein